MAKSKVLTVRDLSFSDERTGELIEGRQLWLLTPTKDPDWNGYEVEKVWLKINHELYETVGQLRHGMEVMIDYNRKGKPEDIVICSDVA